MSGNAPEPCEGFRARISIALASGTCPKAIFFSPLIVEEHMRRSSLFTTLVLISAPIVAAAQSTSSSLLPIDKAYEVTADTKTAGVVTVHFKIADTYYLYREQMKFKAGADTLLGTPKLPDGAKFHDEFAGDVEIYHHGIDAIVPYSVAPGAGTVHLSVGYQGCHETDPKLCYPPHTKTFDLPVNGVSASGAPVAGPAAAQPNAAEGAARYAGTPAAREFYKQAKEKWKEGDAGASIDLYKKAIDTDPNYAAAQSEYVMFQRSRNSLIGMFKQDPKATPEERNAVHDKNRALDKVLEKKLIDEYTALMAQHPRDAIYPWALGMVYNESDLAKQQSLCEKAVQIDPQFAQGYECLASTAGIRGTPQQTLDYARKAFELAPDDSEIVSLYAFTLGERANADPTELEALLKRFPDNYAVAMTLTDQANALKPESARLAALERLRHNTSSSVAAKYAAEHLYATYIDSDLTKAHALSEAMAGAGKKKNPQWTGRVTYTAALIKAKAEIAAAKPNAAQTTLKTVEAQKDQGPDKQWYLVQAEALDAAGHADQALTLLTTSFAASPSDLVLDAIHREGSKLGKTAAQLDAEVWAKFQAQAKPFKPFTLKRLDNGQPLSLADYKGKVVMIDFWYPNCGPCRASFPFMQQAAVKYKNQGFTVLAINSVEDQEPFAQPYLTQKKYDFIGLAGTEKWAGNEYGVQGFPTTFLLGADGQLYLKPHLYDAAHERSTELAIETLLEAAKS